VFVKEAVDEQTLGWLRAEQAIYDAMAGSFMPAVVASGDGILILEDLSPAHWPPPWSPGHVEAVRRALDELHALAPPPALPGPEDKEDLRGGWRTVAASPAPFLSLGMCTPEWLEHGLPALVDASDRAALDGDSVIHMDVRSDNLCLIDGRCKLVDWNWACRGNPDLDVAYWLPSLRLEGGPEPEGHGELAAVFAGYLAARAGLPEPVKGVRAIQKAQLTVALPWAARELGLSRPRPR
jgi:Ser/Thr protein kinase RdoA (MazF antagonist)